MRAAVVGGGLIGVEVAEILHDRGLHVTFVIREGWYFPVALDANEAALVAEHMRGHGVDVRLGATRRRESCAATTAGSAACASPGGGELAADLVVSTIGVVPNTGFLAGSAVCAGGERGDRDGRRAARRRPPTSGPRATART